MLIPDAKGGKGREVPLIPGVRDAMKDYLAVRLQASERTLPLSSRLKRVSANGVQRVVRQLETGGLVGIMRPEFCLLGARKRGFRRPFWHISVA